MASPNATAEIDVAARPETIYGLITDLDAFAELTEETAAMKWAKGGSATPGSQFTGKNRNGWHRWSTKCTVTDAEPGKRFAFEVTSMFGIKVARWQYDIATVDGGCRVTESTWDRRPGWFKGIAGVATGVPKRDEANAEHIKLTLERLKTKAESAAE